ncbi:MAG: type II toxin-antitoxin system VapC family toxin [Anaerolineae bacterium]|nr:type II toxin-antitoxin system VapC family toxin [Anaerolineae bacterium]
MGSQPIKVSAALSGIKSLYIEAAPLIYYVEENPIYIDRMDAIVEQIEDVPIEGVSSVITLTEVLTHPLRLGQGKLVQEYQNILLHSVLFRLIPVTAKTAELAADLRARYHLRSPDALHIATAIEYGCGAFLTNDLSLKRVAEIPILILDELEK